MDNKKTCRVCLQSEPVAKFKKGQRRCTTCRHASEPKSTDPRLGLLKWAKARAKLKGREINISIEDIPVPTLCPIIGIPLKAQVGSQGAGSPSLDRIDTTKGYTKGNVRVISLAANMMKGTMTLPQLRQFVENIQAYINSAQ